MSQAASTSQPESGGPGPSRTGGPIRRQPRGDREQTPRGHAGRGWSDAAPGRGTPGPAGLPQQQTGKERSSGEPSEGVWPRRPLGFRLLASRTITRQISGIPVCGTL